MRAFVSFRYRVENRVKWGCMGTEMSLAVLYLEVLVTPILLLTWFVVRASASRLARLKGVSRNRFGWAMRSCLHINFCAVSNRWTGSSVCAVLAKLGKCVTRMWHISTYFCDPLPIASICSASLKPRNWVKQGRVECRAVSRTGQKMRPENFESLVSTPTIWSYMVSPRSRALGETYEFEQMMFEYVCSLFARRRDELKDEIEISNFSMKSVPVSVRLWNLVTFFRLGIKSRSISCPEYWAKRTIVNNHDSKWFWRLERGKSVKWGTRSKFPVFPMSTLIATDFSRKPPNSIDGQIWLWTTCSTKLLPGNSKQQELDCSNLNWAQTWVSRFPPVDLRTSSASGSGHGPPAPVLHNGQIFDETGGNPQFVFKQQLSSPGTEKMLSDRIGGRVLASRECWSIFVSP